LLSSKFCLDGASNLINEPARLKKSASRHRWYAFYIPAFISNSLDRQMSRQLDCHWSCLLSAYCKDILKACLDSILSTATQSSSVKIELLTSRTPYKAEWPLACHVCFVVFSNYILSNTDLAFKVDASMYCAAKLPRQHLHLFAAVTIALSFARFRRVQKK
jgi:hypothetical protein